MRFTIFLMIIGLLGASLVGKAIGHGVLSSFEDALVQPLQDSMSAIDEAIQ